MIDKLGLNTDNFYKFLTTLSLLAFIYCSSFDTLFLSPYNKLIIENNIQTSKLGAEEGYLKGVSKDLTTLVPDSIRKNNIAYFHYNYRDSTDLCYYYCSINLERYNKEIVDSLNLINKQLAEKIFIIKTIEDANLVHEKNIKVRGLIMNIVAIISLLIFLFGLCQWYILRKEIDK